MFLRANHREKDGKRHTYWSLVETVRTPDGPRQRTLCHLGELNDSAQARWLKTIDVFKDAGDRHSMGGTDDASNLIAQCSVCNEGAANTTLNRPESHKLKAQCSYDLRREDSRLLDTGRYRVAEHPPRMRDTGTRLNR